MRRVIAIPTTAKPMPNVPTPHSAKCRAPQTNTASAAVQMMTGSHMGQDGNVHV